MGTLPNRGGEEEEEEEERQTLNADRRFTDDGGAT